MLARLDDQGSQRYLPEQDIIPSINSGLGRMQSAAGWALANRKGSEEMLRDFSRITVFQTSSTGNILVDDPALGEPVADIVAVYPLPLTEQAQTILPNNSSLVRSDLTFAGPSTPCQRVTWEMAPVIRTNASMRGNEVLAANPERRSWAYCLNQGRVYLLPKSQASSILTAIAYIQKFAPMTTTTSTVDVPEYCAEILASWALSYIAWKQDSQGQGVGNLASRDAAELFQLGTN